MLQAAVTATAAEPDRMGADVCHIAVVNGNVARSVNYDRRRNRDLGLTVRVACRG